MYNYYNIIIYYNYSEYFLRASKAKKGLTASGASGAVGAPKGTQAGTPLAPWGLMGCR